MGLRVAEAQGYLRRMARRAITAAASGPIGTVREAASYAMSGPQVSSTAGSTALTNALRSRGRLVLLLFGLACVHGLALNLMPVLFPTIGEAFSVPKAQQGLLQTAFTVGMVAALIVAGYLINLLGAKRVAAAVMVLAGLAAVLFGLARTYVLVLGSAMLLGMSMASLTAVYAAIITSKFADIRRQMYMWTFAALAGSATLSTSLIGGLVDRFQYSVVFVVFGLFIWVWALSLFSAAGRALEPDVGRARLASDEPTSHSDALPRRLSRLLRFLAEGLLNRGVLYLLGMIVILDTLASGNVLAWAPSYFGETYRLGNIGLVLSASSAGVFLGRLVLGALPPGAISDRVLLGLCYAGAMAAFGLILLLHPSVYVAIALIALNGALVSAQAPTTYSIATSQFRDRTPAAIPLIDAMGNLGGLVGPSAAGIPGRPRRWGPWGRDVVCAGLRVLAGCRGPDMGGGGQAARGEGGPGRAAGGGAVLKGIRNEGLSRDS
jgi:FSR family fosmidomycin resistance protein-like MFS transporter